MATNHLNTQSVCYRRLIDYPDQGRRGTLRCRSHLGGGPDSQHRRREQVDLIAMYTHDRRGLAKIIKGSIAQRVKEKSPVEVRTFPLRELEAVGA